MQQDVRNKEQQVPLSFLLLMCVCSFGILANVLIKHPFFYFFFFTKVKEQGAFILVISF